jgi:hypothetical protein
VACKTGRLPEEIEELYRPDDLLRWSAYFQVANERQKQSIEEARREAEAKKARS